jgi:3-dehydrosphinganine reductase
MAGRPGWPPRHAIVTGGTSGIGLAAARRLAALGGQVSLLAVDGVDPALATLRASRRRPTQQLDGVQADVTDAGAVRAAAEALAASHGACDLLLAAAGGAAPGLVDQLDEAVFRAQMELNYLGALHAVLAVLPAMARGGGGRIVLVSSTLGVTGGFGYAAYSPAKFAVRGLAEALCTELRPRGILVSCAIPAATDTPGHAREQRAKSELLRRAAPPGRLLAPDQVAAAILDGARRGRFLICADRRTRTLVRVSSVLAPLLRARLDRAVERASKGAESYYT